ncbi:3' terminal RNA ribose 2'-O-methyltransferase Hen1 [Nocardia sp. SYP-A9097]|uniref:3' terminal RNA ribose 2'-O-methyltransferase Hen1 n=1 Tax=Nocardia sp. SYP-A9097 TaxID=2663237 RepID=UPI00129B3BB4|nr:3' terminal RNA ribose 2'-O-methyltransferase Hen1 [Nocardia sp. SYP-A9097]MRH89191.1 3' terminal RNA ribose 2'-O-methyltransferase Hen1 [Nocardia sp. SYP-A9097]
MRLPGLQGYGSIDRVLLTITCTRPDGAAWAASELGYLLHKNPGKAQTFEQSYGVAHVLYPEASEERCTAALLLEIDPVRLVRGKTKGAPEFSLGQYVNDRPYAASSLLSVAISTVLGSALHGRCTQRPELVETELPLRIELPAVPCKGGPDTAEQVFGPLGWTVEATPLPLDPAFPEWGDSHYLRLELTGAMRLSDALSHLYVLLPVLDGSKHYFLDAGEIDKLLRFGAGWLNTHPARDWITRRYLARRHSLVRAALARLAELDDLEPEQFGAVDVNIDDLAREVAAATAEVARATAAALPDADLGAPNDATTSGGTSTPDGTGSPSGADAPDGTESAGGAAAPDKAAGPADQTAGPADGVDGEAEAPVRSLAVMRRAAVLEALRAAGARRVLDLGCGEGALLRELVADRTFDEIVGIDVSVRSLRIAERRMRRLPLWQTQRVSTRQGALTYTDASLRGYDAAVLMEVIEHVDLTRLNALEQAVFGAAAPGAVLVTTPNGEYNTLYEGLADGAFRHSDHRFEWSRAEFTEWAARVGETYGYTVRFEPIGIADDELGAPTQMAVFTKTANDEKGAV